MFIHNILKSIYVSCAINHESNVSCCSFSLEYWLLFNTVSFYNVQQIPSSWAYGVWVDNHHTFIQLLFTQEFSFADVCTCAHKHVYTYTLKSRKIKTNCLKHDNWTIVIFSEKAQVWLWMIKYFHSGTILLYIFIGGAIKSVEKKQTCCHKITL